MDLGWSKGFILPPSLGLTRLSRVLGAVLALFLEWALPPRFLLRVRLVEEWRRMEWLNSYFMDVWFPTKDERSGSWSLHIEIYHK